MKKDRNWKWKLASLLYILFGLFTLMVAKVDVKPIGPEGSTVGFAGINGFLAEKTGVNEFWYEFTNLLGIVSILVALGFAALGLWQLVKGKQIRKVDVSLIYLGVFYMVLLMCYLGFEEYVINYRPVILDGKLEASYPSSHTMLVVCIMSTAVMQIQALWPDRKRLYILSKIVASGISLATVTGRILSGVHWFTDILGALLLSAALVVSYWALLDHSTNTGIRRNLG